MRFSLIELVFLIVVIACLINFYMQRQSAVEVRRKTAGFKLHSRFFQNNDLDGVSPRDYLPKLDRAVEYDSKLALEYERLLSEIEAEKRVGKASYIVLPWLYEKGSDTGDNLTLRRHFWIPDSHDCELQIGYAGFDKANLHDAESSDQKVQSVEPVASGKNLIEATLRLSRNAVVVWQVTLNEKIVFKEKILIPKYKTFSDGEEIDVVDFDACQTNRTGTVVEYFDTNETIVVFESGKRSEDGKKSVVVKLVPKSS